MKFCLHIWSNTKIVFKTITFTYYENDTLQIQVLTHGNCYPDQSWYTEKIEIVDYMGKRFEYTHSYITIYFAKDYCLIE